ncbi:hypothetical protein COLO4_24407 [Corchorus olitorius]|uniref:Coiled-coil domain-containing protein 86 n=1 Tax=Corchorus olitorius TaxID=93759 RepID=A0A1R3IAE1_9ROSI|nr:hypothetical protein COLO4_24407 [Corchorus olitorius]
MGFLGEFTAAATEVTGLGLTCSKLGRLVAGTSLSLVCNRDLLMIMVVVYAQQAEDAVHHPLASSEIRQNKIEKRKKREERDEKKKKENILRFVTMFLKITNPNSLKKIAKSKQEKFLFDAIKVSIDWVPSDKAMAALPGLLLDFINFGFSGDERSDGRSLLRRKG